MLALQGDVREHCSALEQLGATVVRVRRSEHLNDIDALIIPGGESTTIARLLITSGLRETLETRLRAGLPVLGTCAGLILLSREVLDGRSDQWSTASLDLSLRRNGYGRQIASFESTVEVQGVGSVTGVFIRAPKIELWASGVEVLATLGQGAGEHPVMVRQARAWGCSFHPELTGDTRVHQLFLESLDCR